MSKSKVGRVFLSQTFSKTSFDKKNSGSVGHIKVHKISNMVMVGHIKVQKISNMDMVKIFFLWIGRDISIS